MPARLLPKHSPALRPGDLEPYLLDRVRPGSPHRKLDEVWRTRLPDRAVFGTRAGRHALWHFLEATSPPPGSEVLVAAYNYYVVVRILVQKGLRPVFVDIDRGTLGMDAEDLRRKITPASSLVIATHMFGIPADVEGIAGVCDEHGLPLFEDCAHAVGTTVGDRHVGRFGQGALFSFGPFKSVTCFGGGMLAVAPGLAGHVRTDSPAASRPAARWGTFLHMLVALLSSPGLYGWTLQPLMRFARDLAERGFGPLRDLVAPSKDLSSYRFTPDAHPPFRAFMPDVLYRQLARLEQDLRSRRDAIAEVKDALRSHPAAEFLEEDRHGRANGSYFGMYVPDPEAFAARMLRHGVEVNPHEFYDCSRLAQFGDYQTDCPNAAFASSHLVRLPSYATLSDRDVARIAEAARRSLGHQGFSASRRDMLEPMRLTGS
ncbi:MAG TPA: DegT/DnrJ/EryC1/StrS family aminotransferase [Solirubrobacteraceae bacterium]|jgi:dTDP-4-amino-4,6-dideoxygalactose transaminase